MRLVICVGVGVGVFVSAQMVAPPFNMSTPNESIPEPTVESFYTNDDALFDDAVSITNALGHERQFLAVVILALTCAVLAIFGMIGILAMQVRRLAEMLRNARAAAAAAVLPDAKTGLLSNQISGKLTSKKTKKTTFEDTSCAGPRDLDEEEI